MPHCPHGDQWQVESLRSRGRYCSMSLSATLAAGPSAPSAHSLTTPRCVKRCHPEGPWHVWEMGQCKPHEVQQSGVIRPTPGSRQSQAHPQGGQKSDWQQSCREGLGVMVDENSTWAISVCSQPRKPVPGCSNRSVASRPREGILPLYSAL